LIELHGWRLTHSSDVTGRKQVELRCPACWSRYRARTNASGTHDVPSFKSFAPSSRPEPKKSAG
jgi:hypothetical protein